jgi:putative transposase
MKRRFSEEQIISILKQQESGVATSELCRQHNPAHRAPGSATFYKWKAKFGGVNASEAQKLRQLEAENAKLKRIVADQALDNIALKDLLSDIVLLRAGQEAMGVAGARL